jgi:hypothetical protein
LDVKLYPHHPLVSIYNPSLEGPLSASSTAVVLTTVPVKRRKRTTRRTKSLASG